MPVESADRGRGAEAPHEIPVRGWKDILIRTWKEFTEDQAPLVAEGVIFYSLLDRRRPIPAAPPRSRTTLVEFGALARAAICGAP